MRLPYTHAHFVELEQIELTFMEEYLKAKCELGSEDLKILSVLFFGPSEASFVRCFITMAYSTIAQVYLIKNFYSSKLQ